LCQVGARQSVQFCSNQLKIAGKAQIENNSFSKLLKMINTEQSPKAEPCTNEFVKAKELTLKQVFSVPCPTCGASIKEPCELNSGARRTEPHRDRKLSAADAVEAQAGKR
jgi:hypothetical protein